MTNTTTIDTPRLQPAAALPPPIQVRQDDEGLLCPVLVCAWCGEPITDAQAAVVDYDPADPESGKQGVVLAGHKSCLGSARPTRYWAAPQAFLARLLWNVTRDSDASRDGDLRDLRAALEKYLANREV